MTTRPVQDRAPQPGDTITVTTVVRKVHLNGHVAICDTVYGSVWVPLPGPNALPDPAVVVTAAPTPATVHEIGGR